MPGKYNNDVVSEAIYCLSSLVMGASIGQVGLLTEIKDSYLVLILIAQMENFEALAPDSLTDVLNCVERMLESDIQLDKQGTMTMQYIMETQKGID